MKKIKLDSMIRELPRPVRQRLEAEAKRQGIPITRLVRELSLNEAKKAIQSKKEVKS